MTGSGKPGSFLAVGGVTLAALAGAAVFTYLIMNMARILTFVDCVYTDGENGPHLIIASAETMHGEDGEFLRGYRIDYVDLATGKLADKKFMDRDADNIPPLPAVRLMKNQDLWLVGQKELIQGSTGYMARFRIRNGKIDLSEKIQPEGYAINGFSGLKHVKLINRFNEVYCYDLTNSKLLKGACPSEGPEPYEGRKTAFILVNKNPGASRYRIFYYETDQTDPMQIHAGSGTGQSLLYRLWFSHNILSEKEFVFYKNKLKPQDKMVEILTGEYLNSPSTLYTDSNIAVYADKPTPDTGRIFCVNREGKILWKIDDKKYTPKNKDSTLKARIYDKIILVFGDKWAIGVNRESNKVQWSYFF